MPRSKKESEASPLVVSSSPNNQDYGATNNESDEKKKNSGTARAAYQSGDVAASRAEHQKRSVHHENHGGAGSAYIKSIVFGGLDGIMTTFAIVTAAAGSDTNYKMVLVLGISNVLADAFSMGFGEYVSGSAERDFALEERRREEWEVAHSKDLEIKEMVELYEEKGLSHEDATRITEIISKDDKVFVDFMMVDELQILVDTEDQWEPAKQGLAMFLSFICFGMLPISAYILAGTGHGVDWVFALACGLVAVGLLVLGAIRGHLTNMSIPISAVTMLFNGCVSGGMSYLVSSLLDHAIES